MDLAGTYTITQDNSADSYTWISGDINGLSAPTPTAASNVATKAYVDAAVSGAGGYIQ